MAEKDPATSQILGDRVRTLEDEFFRKEDQRLTARLQELKTRAMSREVLARASGIKSEMILDRLLDLGIRPEIVGALAVVPLAEVAWADGSLDDEERRAVLERAEQSGVARGSTDHDLLSSWLNHRPDAKLLSAWKHMVQGLCEHMTTEQVADLRRGLIERARTIAKASGGVFGLGAVSAAEADMIEQLESAFRKR
jgi:hypothetical protein